MQVIRVLAAVVVILVSFGVFAEDRAGAIASLLRADLVRPFEHECRFRDSSCNSTVNDVVNIFGCASTPGRNFVNFHTVTIPANRRVTIKARSSAFSTLLVLFNSKPEIVKSATAGRNAEAVITYDVPAGDEYVVAVAPVEDFGTGAYTLSITCERVSEPPPPPTCTLCSPNPNTACMLGGRMKVTMTWTDPYAGTSGTGRVVTMPGRPDSETYWSMYPQAPDALELVVRIVDGRGLNNKFWTSAGGFGVAGYTVRIQDTVTCAVWERTVAAGSSEIVKDTNALPGN